MNETDTSPKPLGRTKRSPNYPGIDLELALERAQVLYKHEHHYPTDIATALAHWGYKPKSGGGLAALAAVKAFGLLEDEGRGGERFVSVSQFAVDIFLEEDPDRLAGLIQEAAIRPPVHYELWNRFGTNLPSDSSITRWLTYERGFTPNGAREALSEWKRTMQFAALAEDRVTVSPDVPDAQPEAEDAVTDRPPDATARVIQKAGGAAARAYGGGAGISKDQIVIPVPLNEGMATVSLPLPVSDESWDRLFAVLEAYKPLTATPAPFVSGAGSRQEDPSS